MARGVRMMDELRQDLRYALRTLRRTPAFTVVVILTLALGIGATTAIYSVVNAVLVRPLPYQDPASLVMVWEKDSVRQQTQVVSYFNFFYWRAGNQLFENMAAFSGGIFVYDQPGGKEIVYGATVSGTFFLVLKVKAAQGRVLLTTDEKEGETVVLSHQFWIDRMGSDPNVLGRRLKFSDKSYTVVGVMPRDFRPVLPGFSQPERGFSQPQFWVPINSDNELRRSRGSWLRVVARTKPGVSLAQASTEMDAIATRLARENRGPVGVAQSGVAVTPLREQIVGNVRTSLLLLLGAVGFVLLIACINVANLFFVRTLGREKEFALRAVLGAERVRILRQQLTESGLIALTAGILSLLAVRWGVDLIIASCPRMIPRVDEITVDFRVFLFALGLSILIGALFGLFPALRTARLDLNSIVKQAPEESGRPRGRYRDVLPVFEIAFAIVLATGAALLMNSFIRLTNVDPGFKRENILIWQVSLNQQGSTPRSLNEEILDRVDALPRVAASGIVSVLPLAGEGGSVSYRVKDVLGQSRPDLGEILKDIDDMRVSPGYFRAMSLSFLHGGTFSETAPDAQAELIVSESLARKLWPVEDPIGKRLNLGSRSNPWVPVVGVVRDVRQHGLQQEPRLTLYRPYRGGGYFSLVVQAKSDARSLIPDIRNRILSVDQTALIYRVQSMEEILSSSVSQPRFYTVLFAMFATLAISLAATGVYGVASYSVSFRTRELGIRIALGARPQEIMRLVLTREMVKASIGAVLGMLFALVLTRFLTSLLFEVEPGDPLTLILATAVITLVALLACYIPARRATKIDPMVALKEL